MTTDVPEIGELKMTALYEWYSDSRIKAVLKDRKRDIVIEKRSDGPERIDVDKTLADWLADRIVRRAIAAHMVKRGVEHGEAMERLKEMAG